MYLYLLLGARGTLLAESVSVSLLCGGEKDAEDFNRLV